MGVCYLQGGTSPFVCMPTKERLNELFEYEEQSGRLIRRTSAGGRKKGSYAGHERDRHTVIRVDDCLQLAHRVIWTMVRGPIPKDKEIDHIDGNSQNNRLGNLRLVNHKTNGRNCRLSKNNTTGFNGVYRTRSGKWAAEISVSGVKHCLGIFLALEQAVSARREADRVHGFHPNHGKKRAVSNRDTALAA